jgi:hypothetical protein
MKLYIKLLNRHPVEHPHTEENMETAFPHVDLNNLPEDWAEFVRVPQPRIGPYEVAEVAYEWVGDVVKDVWYTHTMSAEEKLQKQQRVKNNYALDGGFANWIFDEERCCHVAPVPYPQDGKPYIWVQEAEAWVEIKLPTAPMNSRPAYPTDGNVYNYDESTNTWIPRP